MIVFHLSVHNFATYALPSHSSARRLKCVNFSENQLGDSGLTQLLDTLHADTLCDLDLSHTRSQVSTGSDSLVQALLTFVTSSEEVECVLTELNLSGCQLNTQEVLALNRSPFTSCDSFSRHFFFPNDLHHFLLNFLFPSMTHTPSLSPRLLLTLFPLPYSSTSIPASHCSCIDADVF